MEVSQEAESDYEPCGECGFDHSYEPEEAFRWHEKDFANEMGLSKEEVKNLRALHFDEYIKDLKDFYVGNLIGREELKSKYLEDRKSKHLHE